MPRKAKHPHGVEAWSEIDRLIQERLPHLHSVLADEADFIEFRIKAREDNTSLAILKRYGSDGAPVVCFGSGYGAIACLLAIDATIQGGYWQKEIPWQERMKQTDK